MRAKAAEPRSHVVGVGKEEGLMLFLFLSTNEVLNFCGVVWVWTYIVDRTQKREKFAWSLRALGSLVVGRSELDE